MVPRLLCLGRRSSAALALFAIGLIAAATDVTADGSLDPAFQSAGRYSLTLSNDPEEFLVGGIGHAAAPERTFIAYSYSLAGDDFDIFLRSVPDSGPGVECPIPPLDGASPYNEFVTDLAMGPGGKPTIVGYRDGPLGNAEYQGLVLRYLPDCTPDPTWNGGAPLILDFAQPVTPAAVAYQSDGKVVVLSTYGSGNGRDLLVQRFTAAGVLDPTFAGGGGVLFDPPFGGVGQPDWADDLAIDLQDRILVSGRRFDALTGTPTISRFLAGGALDLGFHLTGFTALPDAYPKGSTQLAAFADGSVLAGFGRQQAAAAFDFYFRRMLPDGFNDPDFGVNGETAMSLGDVSAEKHLTAMQVLGDRTVLLVGSMAAPNRSHTDLLVARVLPTGIDPLDPSFGTGGSLLVPFDLGSTDAQRDDLGQRAAFIGNGRLLVGGVAENDQGTALAAIRLKLNRIFSDAFESGSTDAW